MFSFLNVPVWAEIKSCVMLTLSDVQSFNAFWNICKKTQNFLSSSFPTYSGCQVLAATHPEKRGRFLSQHVCERAERAIMTLKVLW